MKYKLNVQKYIVNTDYEKQMEDYKENSKYSNFNNRNDYPEKFISTTCLEVELTEEEFKKVKLETIKVFE